MQRVATAVIALAVMAVGLYLLVEVGPFRGCRAVAPRELPSGADRNVGVEGVWGGAMQMTWGSGSDRVEQIVGLRYDGFDDTSTLGDVEIGGLPAVLYRFKPDANPGYELAISWEEGGCSLSVFLPAGMTEAQARDFAARY